MVKNIVALCVVAIGLLLSIASSDRWYWQDIFLTRDQQGMLYYNAGDYRKAAHRFENPEWQAMAFYAAEDFKAAAQLWTRVEGAQALFNRGNALAHAEQYQDAADSYRLALGLDSNFFQAKNNLELVLVLARKSQELDEYVPQSEGKMEADDVTFDQGGKRMENALSEVAENEFSSSTKEIQALWVDRLQATPADFLRLKFRYQYEMESSQSSETVVEGADG